jgi:hypothetical protein
MLRLFLIAICSVTLISCTRNYTCTCSVAGNPILTASFGGQGVEGIRNQCQDAGRVLVQSYPNDTIRCTVR